jgi:peptide/nickel transport system permease protein
MTMLRFTLRSWSGRLGAVLVGLLVLAVVLSYLWVPYNPERLVPTDRWMGMSVDHWFGTDGGGRDVFSFVIVGARVSLFVALGSAAVAAVVGLTLGVLSEILPRMAGESVAYLVDVLLAIPTLVFALVLVGLFKGSLFIVVIAIGVTSGFALARIVKGEVSRVLTQDYILAAQSSGTSTWRTVRRHVLPNIAPIAIVQLSIIAGFAILAEAALSYLGVTSRSRPTLGYLLGELQSTVTIHPWTILFPGLMLVIATLGFNLLGDGLRDAMDPRLRTSTTATAGHREPPPPAPIDPTTLAQEVR